MRPTVATNIITRDQPEALDACLKSVYQTLFVEGDETIVVDTGSLPTNLDKIRAIVGSYRNARLIERPDLAVDFIPALSRWLPDRVEEFKSHYPDGKLIMNFAAARQIALDASTADVVFWIDTDDVLAEQRPGEFRAAIDDCLQPDAPKVDALFLDYEYARDVDGTCITTLRRERAFLRGRYEWLGRCHETACPKKELSPPPRPVAYIEAVATKIVHTDARKPTQFSDMRNYIIMRDELEQAELPDPRSVFYLANACRGLALNREAVSLYKRFDMISGSEDDRFAAWYYVGAIYMDMLIRRPVDAREAYFKCITIKPHDPRGYFGLARADAALKRWQESLQWYELGTQKRMPETQVHSYDPTHINYHSHAIASVCARELDDHEACLKYAGRAYQNRSGFPQAAELVRQAQGFQAAMLLTNGFGSIFANLTYGGPNARRVAREVCAELRNIPPELENRGVGKNEPPDPRPARPSVAFFCGATPHEWGPQARAEGIGGSEKMVILLGEALQRKGCNVSIYANVPYHYRGIDKTTGMLWRHWAEFDNAKPRDVLVAWRNPSYAVGVDAPGKQRVIWLHDIPNPASFGRDVLAAVDFVQFQTQAHASDCPALPPEKTWIARNAIEPTPFSLTEKNPKQVLYCSSPDRGLLTACEIVMRARAIDPEIRLVTAYGFTDWARKLWANNRHPFVPDLGHAAYIDNYEREVYAALDACQAQVCHKVGFEQMQRLHAQSGVWLYPTRFCEISCMSAMEAQQHGCIPVATRKHALAETISPLAEPWRLEEPPLPLAKYNDWLDAAARTLVRACNVAPTDLVRQALALEADERFNVDTLANIWITKLGLRPVVAAGKEGNDCSCKSPSPLIEVASACAESG